VYVDRNVRDVCPRHHCAENPGLALRNNNPIDESPNVGDEIQYGGGSVEQPIDLLGVIREELVNCERGPE
jgi:hypothetical protein